VVDSTQQQALVEPMPLQTQADQHKLVVVDSTQMQAWVEQMPLQTQVDQLKAVVHNSLVTSMEMV
jgi:hypothetical protein